MALCILRRSFSAWKTNNYLIWDNVSNKGSLIDVTEGVSGLLDEAEEKGIHLESIILTHGHYDHVSGLPEVVCRYRPLKVYLHPKEKEDIEAFVVNEGDVYIQELQDGDVVEIGTEKMTVLHTPGHKPGAICLYNDEIIFTGDTVFIGGYGRTDLEGGDIVALKESFKKLRRLPDHLKVYTGHQYGNKEISTLGEEKNNI